MASRAAESGVENPRWFHGLAFVFGLAVSHGRALVLLAPALAVLLWRPYFAYVRRKPLVLLLHSALAFIPWLSYLYLPLRAFMGAEWTFSEPTDWEGLRPYITADETRTNITFAASPAEWFERTRLHLDVLNTELLPGVLIVGLTAALVVPLLTRRRIHAAFFAAAWLPFFAAAYVAYVGYIWDAYLAVLMPVTLIGVLGLGMGASWLAELRLAWGRVAVGGLLITAVAAAALNYGYVSQLKAATRGRAIIENFKPALDLRGPGRVVLSATWGLDYFALAYGALVNHELPGVVAVDQSAPFAELIAAGDRVYVLPQFFYVFGLDFWDGKLGRAHLTSAAPGIIRVAASPPLTLVEVPNPDPHLIGDSISLLGHQIRFEPKANALRVTLYWQSSATPSQDYSVFVHLSDQPAISTGEDILAQSDSAVPVYGFYPTTRWSAGEIVREDYTIPLPDSRRPALLRVGLYTRTADGGFNNLGEANFGISIP
ncbi:MAG TPA: hypothetical protein VJ020_02930, partial [Anaerolineales bacterium]|nr:hypothetical protein [Anaerolineales bacterium]